MCVLAEVDYGLGTGLPPAGSQQELPGLPEVAGRCALLEGDAHPEHKVSILHVLLQNLKNIVRRDAIICNTSTDLGSERPFSPSISAQAAESTACLNIRGNDLRSGTCKH